MWVIQDRALVRLPDNAPVPPSSRVVEVPPDFNPRDYRVENGALVKGVPARGTPTDKLTREEIVRLKAALSAGQFGPKRRKEDS